jgi:hypothetical protein
MPSGLPGGLGVGRSPQRACRATTVSDHGPGRLHETATMPRFVAASVTIPRTSRGHLRVGVRLPVRSGERNRPPEQAGQAEGIPAGQPPSRALLRQHGTQIGKYLLTWRLGLLGFRGRICRLPAREDEGRGPAAQSPSNWNELTEGGCHGALLNRMRQLWEQGARNERLPPWVVRLSVW